MKLELISPLRKDQRNGISDLHLSANLNENTRKYSRNEEFFFDKQFDDFLAYHQREYPGNNHLIINGDSLNFLQVNDPLTKELKKTGGGTFSISDREEKYGLGTEIEARVSFYPWFCYNKKYRKRKYMGHSIGL